MTKHKVILIAFAPGITGSPDVRPALCLSEATETGDTVVVAFISSNIPEKLLDTDILLKTSSPDFRGTGLIKNAVIRMHTLMSVPRPLIKRQIGMINEHTQKKVASCMDKIFNGSPRKKKTHKS